MLSHTTQVHAHKHFIYIYIHLYTYAAPAATCEQATAQKKTKRDSAGSTNPIPKKKARPEKNRCVPKRN